MINTVSSSNLRSDQLTRVSQYHQKLWAKINRIGYLPSENKYNLTISEHKRFIWFRVPKVGTRTILKIFQDQVVSLDAEHPYNCYYPPRRYSEYYKFGFVRNPWDRVVSCWLDKVINGNLYNFSQEEHDKMKDLENFIGYIEKLDLTKCDAHLRLQSNLVDLNNIDYLGRYESFSDDLTRVLQTLGMDGDNIPNVNKSQRVKSDFREYYSSSTAKRVAVLYARDINIFGYQF